MKELLITGGCSFTAHKAKEHLAWPWHFRGVYSKKGIWVENVAEMASGNSLIYRNLIAGIERLKKTNKTITVAVMWSNPNRFELLIDREMPEFKSMFDDFKNSTTFTNQILGKGVIYTHVVENWLKSGGGFGQWQHKNNHANQLHKNYLKYIHSEKLQFLQTLENIVHLQQYCELNQIPLINLTWENIFLGVSDITGSNVKQDKSNLLPYIDSIPTAKYLWDMIKWENWWFYGEYGGLKEYCIDNGYPYVNGNHPCTDCQLNFAMDIVYPLYKKAQEKVGRKKQSPYIYI